MTQRNNYIVAAGLLVFAAVVKASLYPFNFSPIIAIALFGGACFSDKKLAFILPVLSMFLSDVLIEMIYPGKGFWGIGQLFQYGIFPVITLIGASLKKLKPTHVVMASVLSTLTFFVLSNSAVWTFDTHDYAMTFSGWVSCLVKGVPFIRTGLFTDLVYSAMFFGGYYLISRKAEQKVIA